MLANFYSERGNIRFKQQYLMNYVLPISSYHAPWAFYQIRKIAGCACAGNAGNVFPRHPLQRKPLVSDPAMHHGTCVTHVPWCMSGSLTSGGGEIVPGIPGACATRNFTYLARGPLSKDMCNNIINSAPQQKLSTDKPLLFHLYWYVHVRAAFSS